MTTDGEKLLERMNFVGERLSALDPKPKNLPHQELVQRVADFMLSLGRLQVTYAFANEVGEELEDRNDVRFDPIAFFAAAPECLDDISMFVEFELQTSEMELLARKDKSIFAYNTLVFGAALRLARKELLSTDLMSFLIDHLINPSPPKVPKKRSKPKRTNDNLAFKLAAVAFAKSHGLDATRNDATVGVFSACDVVSEAAVKLYKATGDHQFISGYTYASLKKLWGQDTRFRCREKKVET